MSLIRYAWLVPLLPLLGAAVAAAGGRWLRGRSHWPVVVGIALACIVSLGLLAQTGDGTGRVTVYSWIDAGALHVPVEFRVDGLTTMMLAMVTFVATIIAVFSSGYMAGDPGYPRFFALMGLFVFSMTGLVLSNNYVLTYAFWEGVGVCSYLLIGFWHTRPSAAAAAKKAFLVNRVGDVGFAIALFWMWSVVPGHDLSYDNVLAAGTIDSLPQATLLGIALLLFWGATAKSAQVPLYVWLPDAMEGPTPVSALIHAATMVTAGVYLIARSAPLVFAAPAAPPIIASIGCLTALLAAAIALTQHDLKRVLAYSTVSQLGYMFMGLGAGVGGVMRLAVVAAMFHLFTHAFFKALLFLGSGSVMHAMGHVIDMRRFGGLRHRMPITCWTFAVGGLALAGLFPLAGFWSKDEVLLALKLASEESHAGHQAGRAALYGTIYWVAVLTALMTAFYTGRAFFRTFFGPEKLPSPDDPEAEPVAHDAHDGGHDHGHNDAHHHEIGHESPPVMTVPLIVLAVGSVLVGLAFGPTGLFEHHLEHTPGFEQLHAGEHGTGWATVGISTIAALLGLGLSAWMYALPNPLPARLAQQLRPLYLASSRKFYVDEFYRATVVAPTRIIAKVSAFLDTYVVDSLVRLVAWVPRLVGNDLLGPLQNGLIQFYAGASVIGLTALLLYLMFS